MKKQKCYIAGKITGLWEAEAKANFQLAEKVVEALGYEPVNPMTLNHDHDKTWESYMKVCISELVKCDAIYMQSNFAQSQGAKLEHRLALDLKLRFHYEQFTH